MPDIHCGGPGGGGADELGFDLGPGGNVRLGIAAVRRDFLAACPPAHLDLLEVATYVYCADQAVARGRDWRREFRFRIPVRDPDRWNSAPVRDALVETLTFLTDDRYRFEFVPRPPDPVPDYLTFAGHPFERPVDEVLLFSGGLDSLAAALDAAVVRKQHAVLVQHRSTEKLRPLHDRLLSDLTALAAAAGGQVSHVPVTVNKRADLSREFTQRTRSFLFAALATTVAGLVGRDGFRLGENGVVSLNLPVSPAVVGARASRTTHPRVLNGLARLVAAVTGAPIGIENALLWDTKTDVVRRIADAGGARLIRWTTSCAHTRKATPTRPHCGTCSQCVDRRFAVLSAGLEGDDPAAGYRIELLTGDRADGDPRLQLAGFLDVVRKVERAENPRDFFGLFGEVGRVVRAVGGNFDETGRRIHALYRRHASQVGEVLDAAAARHATSLRHRDFPRGCLLRLVFPGGPADAPPTGDDPPEAPPPAPARPPEPAAAEPNAIGPAGEGWLLRFDQGPVKVYVPDVGLEYLRLVLAEPGVTFTAAELDCLRRRRASGLRPAEGPRTRSSGSRTRGDPVLDDHGRETFRLRLGEIDAMLDTLRDGDRIEGDAIVARLERERAEIVAVLGRAVGLRGRPIDLLGDRNRVRNRVCNPIQRVLKKINRYDKRLGAHLVKPTLTLGYTIRYAPPVGTRWSTTAPPLS